MYTPKTTEATFLGASNAQGIILHTCVQKLKMCNIASHLTEKVWQQKDSSFQKTIYIHITFFL